MGFQCIKDKGVVFRSWGITAGLKTQIVDLGVLPVKDI